MKRLFFIFILAATTPFVMAQEPVIQHRPYLDNRQLHWGFFLGMNMMDMELTNNGYIDPSTGEQWYAEIDRYEPGFTVGVLGELRLNKYLGLRAQPCISFGQKHLVFHEQNSGRDSTQNMKSAYIQVPISLKVAAPRYNNFRPYFTFGATPSFDLVSYKNQAVRPRMFDCFLEVGAGCDLYLPWFKLIPELKFCFGLLDIIDHKRDDFSDEAQKKFTNGISKGLSSMIVLTLYFE